MRFGFSEDTYLNVRDWLLSGMKPNPAIISEGELLDNLRSFEWHLLVSDHFACVLQVFISEGNLIANILLIGGEKNKSLSEILDRAELLYEFLRDENFAKIVCQPRPGFHKILKMKGFKQTTKQDFEKELI
jgi:hypothetical protein